MKPSQSPSCGTNRAHRDDHLALVLCYHCINMNEVLSVLLLQNRVGLLLLRVELRLARLGSLGLTTAAGT